MGGVEFILVVGFTFLILAIRDLMHTLEETNKLIAKYVDKT